MKKAVIIGGNQGGLNMARCLAEAGFEVKLFEKKSRNEVAYDWTDDIAPSVFADLGIPMPPKESYFNKKVWTFVNPAETVNVTVRNGSQEGDISVYRRPLNDYLYDLAKDKAEIVYEKEVERLITAGKAVKGVVVGGENIYADLVVDCSGVNSPFRAALPEGTGIQRNIGKNEAFVAYRGFFKAKEGVEVPVLTNKAYLRHRGRKGISWFIYGDDGIVDILIGTIDELSDDDVKNALEALKEDNPILGDELVKGGFKTTIPVRYPISRMVADGYVLCGDSAFMTIPMMGSGIVCSLDCGKFLKETLMKNDDCSKENLWNYQVAFYKKYASFCGVDLLKRWLLGVNADDLDFLFESGVLDEGMLAGGAGGESGGISFGDILKKAWKGRKRLGLLLQIAGAMGDVGKATKAAEKIPATYEETAVCEWQKRLESFYGKN